MKHSSLVDFYFKRAHFYDLNKTKHNSNHKTNQITLEGEIVHEYCYKVLGFVSSEVIRLKNERWFNKLDGEQIKSVEFFLTKIGMYA